MARGCHKERVSKSVTYEMAGPKARPIIDIMLLIADRQCVLGKEYQRLRHQMFL